MVFPIAAAIGAGASILGSGISGAFAGEAEAADRAMRERSRFPVPMTPEQYDLFKKILAMQAGRLESYNQGTDPFSSFAKQKGGLNDLRGQAGKLANYYKARAQSLVKA